MASGHFVATSAASERPVAAQHVGRPQSGQLATRARRCRRLGELGGAQRRLHQDARSSRRDFAIARRSNPRAGASNAQRIGTTAGMGADEYRPHLWRSAGSTLHRRFVVWIRTCTVCRPRLGRGICRKRAAHATLCSVAHQFCGRPRPREAARWHDCDYW
jgi:hypothetical protein